VKYETKKEKFERKLVHGKDTWVPQPYNGAADQPCPYGCIISKRVAPPLYYNLTGDCRCPSADDCCMNLQYDAEYYETRTIEKAK
jgi:hypothetical protein